jgi:hypothetical protein
LDQNNIGLLAIHHNELFAQDTGSLRLESPLLRDDFRWRGYRGGVFFYERDRQARRPGQIYVQFDLLHRWMLGLDTAPVLSVGQSKEVSLARAHLEDLRLSLKLDSATRPSASWKIAPGNGARLSFFLARADRTGWNGGVLTISADQHLVASEVLRENDPMERWQQVEVDLSPWSRAAADRPVTLSLDLRAEKHGATVGALIGDPVVYAKEPAR